MTFDEMLEATIAMLRRRGRVSERALRRQFEIDGAYLEDLRFELVETLRMARWEEPGVLIWCGDDEPRQPPVTLASVIEAVEADSTSGDEPLLGTGTAEYRQLTVLFCDLVGSTHLASKLGSENFREVIKAYQRCADDVIAGQEGHIAHYMGDGIVVYFGYPYTHEDGAKRAVRAGLALATAVEELAETATEFKELGLAVRVGIHTGLVVVGAMGRRHRENMALGDVPNLAARLQELASPGTVVVSAETHALVQEDFECAARGDHRVKGLSYPVGVYQVVRELAAERGERPRFHLALVGRQSEMELLKDRWRRAARGEGQIVSISGEPGIGKSRLLDAVRDHVEAEGAGRITFRCSRYATNSTLQPIIDHLVHRLGLSDATLVAPERLERVEAFLSDFGMNSDRSVALLAPLLSVELDGRIPTDGITTQRERRETLDLIIRLMLAASRRTPLLIAWEDLQWADPTSLELLGRLVDEVHSERVMVAHTSRSEFHVAWGGRSHVTHLNLTRLTRSQIVTLVREVAGAAIPPEVLDQLVMRTDGVPLFVEEVTKLLVETKSLVKQRPSNTEVGWAIPASLRDSLMARLDRLGPAKKVAQLASAIGRDFSHDLIAAVWKGGGDALQSGLDALVAAELLFPRTSPSGPSYLFKHALLQDVAYESLLKKTRRKYHRQLMEALEAKLSDVVEQRPELVAHHATEAGLPERAIPYWRRAGEQALGVSAHVEAIGHFTRALKLLGDSPGLEGRASEELAVQTSLAVAYTAVRGYGAPEVTAAYARARELCAEVGDVTDLFPVLYGLSRSYMLRARYVVALELADQVTQLAEETGRADFELACNRMAGSVLFYVGRIEEALHRLTLVTEAPPRAEDSVDASLYVVDPVTASHAYASWALWLRGRADEARAESVRAIEVATRRRHPFSLALAHSFAAWFHQFSRDPEATAASARAAISVAEEHDFEFWIGWNQVMLGWARAIQGDEAGLELVETGVIQWRAVGSELGLTYFQYLLADALANGSQWEAASASLAEAFLLSEEAGERWWLPELFRLQGEILLGQAESDPGEAENAFRKSREVAQSLGAHWHGLRATIALARCLAAKGEAAEAERILSEALANVPSIEVSSEQSEARGLLETVRTAR